MLHGGNNKHGGQKLWASSIPDFTDNNGIDVQNPLTGPVSVIPNTERRPKDRKNREERSGAQGYQHDVFSNLAGHSGINSDRSHHLSAVQKGGVKYKSGKQPNSDPSISRLIEIVERNQFVEPEAIHIIPPTKFAEVKKVQINSEEKKYSQPINIYKN